MNKPKKDPIREVRILHQVIVDAHGAEDRAMGWFYYLENQLRFPFEARCIAANIVSPLSKGETVQVLRMAPEQSCSADMLACIRWQRRKWQYLYPNWPRSTWINLLPMRSAIGIIG